MATVYKGNEIGTSKKRGIFVKYSEEGTDMKLLKYGDFLKGSEPFITKDINTADPVDNDTWVRMYKDNSEIAVKKRLEDTARISKFVASPRGVLWESHMAGLETIQKDYAQKQQDKVNKIRQAGESSDPNFGQKVLRTLANLGKSLLQDIGLTASTLSQVAASGTGYHADTYISRAYLKDGKKSSTLNSILSYAGITNGGGVNGAAAALGGAQVIAGTPDPDKLMVPDELATAKGGYGDKNIYGTKPEGRATPRNYTGSLLGSEKYGAFDLHGVTRATGSSDVQRGINSKIASVDKVNLEEERQGKYGKVWDRSAELYKEDMLGGSASSVAKSKEPEEQHYVKDTSYSLGKKDVLVPSRVVLNSSKSVFEEGEGDSKKVLTVYPKVDSPKSYAETEGTVDPKEKSTLDQFHPDGTEKPKPKTVSVRVGKRTVGKTVDNKLSTKERIWTLTYGSKLPIYNYDADSDLTFDDFFMEPDLGLIPFCITTITPEHRIYLNFPAYLESYDDNYTGDWDSVQYIGRAEKFYGYKGFTRSINLSFKVLARNEQQVEPLYRNLNRLVGATAPSYGEKGIFMRGTLASLTIGGSQEGALLRDQLGFIPSVKLSWNTDYPWEIGKKGKDDYAPYGKKFVVPLVLDVNMQFTPIEKQHTREDYEAYFVFDPSETPPTQDPTPATPPQSDKQEPTEPPEQKSLVLLQNGDTYGHMESKDGLSWYVPDGLVKDSR